MKIAIHEVKLTDGSTVHNVVLFPYQGVGYVMLPAVSARDAESLAEKIKWAVEAHTNETVDLVP